MQHATQCATAPFCAMGERAEAFGTKELARLIDRLPLWLIMLLLLAALVAAREFGGWLHGRLARQEESQESTDRGMNV
jgi:hypothetical protein